MVNINSETDNVTDFFKFLGNLERKNSQLFKILSNKIGLLSVKVQLSKIAADNKIHAKILEDLGQKIGNSEIKTKYYKKQLIVVGRTTKKILKKLIQKENITIEELSDYLDILENSGGAVQYLLIQAETFFFMSKEISTLYGMDFLEFSNLLNLITKDFQEHLRLLENVKNIISHRQKKNQVHHPMFMYQNPDAWITPISGRED